MTVLKSFLAAAALAICAATSAIAAEGRIQEVVSPGGIKAWLVAEPAIPLIAVEIGFAGGSYLDPDGKEGAATLVSGLIEEGAGDLSAQEFKLALEDISARMSFEASRDGFYVGMRTLTENRDEAFALLRLALTDPRFDEGSIERVRRQLLASIRRSALSPEAQANQAWYAAMLPDTPYARPSNGTAESVGALTRDDLVAQFARLVGRKQMIVGVVGDITAEELGPLLDETFGALPEGEMPAFDTVELRETGGLDVIEFDVPQSVAVFGHRGILRDDPDYLPAYVANYVLGGGGLTSRLFQEVREERGLAYSVYSYLFPLDRAGLVVGGVATANDGIAESIRLIREEWARMAEEGMTEAELESAKKYLTGSFALRFDSNAKIARYIVGAQEAGLGIDYIDRRNALVEAITLEDIQRVAARLFHPDDLYITVAGKPEGLASQ